MRMREGQEGNTDLWCFGKPFGWCLNSTFGSLILPLYFPFAQLFHLQGLPIDCSAPPAKQFRTNIDDAREEGERRREEKERAEGPIVKLPSGVK